MKSFKSLVVVLLVVGSGLAVQAADDNDTRDLKKMQSDVEATIEAFKKTDSTLSGQLKKAAGYVVFPSVGKGGFIFGGAHGNGLFYEKGKLTGRASLTQVTVGAQIGGQELSQLILFETKEAVAKFKENQFAMSAQVSAVAAAEGASKNAKYVDGAMVFTKAKQGLMAEASVGGQKFKFQPLKK